MITWLKVIDYFKKCPKWQSNRIRDSFVIVIVPALVCTASWITLALAPHVQVLCSLWEIDKSALFRVNPSYITCHSLQNLIIEPIRSSLYCTRHCQVGENWEGSESAVNHNFEARAFFSPPKGVLRIVEWWESSLASNSWLTSMNDATWIFCNVGKSCHDERGHWLCSVFRWAIAQGAI